MNKENAKLVNVLLQEANGTWNYLYETLERLNQKKLSSEKDKEYIAYIWHRAREIKALLVNIKRLLGENIDDLPTSLEISICKKLNKKKDEMVNFILNLDKIY